MEFKGTKGNWKSKYSKKKKYSFISGLNWENHTRVVTKLKGCKKMDLEGVANAKLIAAAPELLEALEYIRKSCKRNSKTAKGCDKIAYIELSHIAEKAIDKALK